MSILPDKPCRLKHLIRDALAKGKPKAPKSRPRGVPHQPSTLELDLRCQLLLAGLVRGMENEFLAVPGRKFRWDLSWPAHRLLVEIQGGVFVKGGHSTGLGIIRDMEKNNLAVLAGYRCLVVSSKHIDSGQALDWIKEALDAKIDKNT